MTESPKRHSHPIFEPHEISDQLQNKFLFLGFKGVFDKSDKAINIPNISIAVFESKDPTNGTMGARQIIIGNINEKNKNDKSDFTRISDLLGIRIPNGFALPAFWIRLYRNLPATITPYGYMPEDVVGADTKVYSFVENYVLNEKGQAAKQLNVIKYPYHKVDETRKMTFTPSENHSTCLRLNSSRHKEIGDLLAHLEEGKYNGFEKPPRFTRFEI
jgi:hypothetical protein